MSRTQKKNVPSLRARIGMLICLTKRRAIEYRWEHLLTNGIGVNTYRDASIHKDILFREVALAYWNRFFGIHGFGCSPFCRHRKCAKSVSGNAAELTEVRFRKNRI
jgi:hypothetical protein